MNKINKITSEDERLDSDKLAEIKFDLDKLNQPSEEDGPYDNSKNSEPIDLEKGSKEGSQNTKTVGLCLLCSSKSNMNSINMNTNVNVVIYIDINLSIYRKILILTITLVL